MQVRRFFCPNAACSRKTFAEPFTRLAAAYARRSSRQANLLQAIAAQVGVDRDSVRRYIRSEDLPEIVRPGRRSHLDPYKGYLNERWATGQRNVKHLKAASQQRADRREGE